ncbi:MAG: response regulator [Thermoproteota archaeon]|nr:response regulator [Thermoproteota archaeon]
MITNTDRDKPLSRLLVVDDDPDNAQVLSLVNYGFLVDAFTNAKEALQKFKSNPQGYHLVLSDSLMPELSGIQLARNVKEHNLNVKVLLLTGSEKIDNEASDVYPSNSVDGFVQKPIVIRKLTDKILSLIDETKGKSSFKD